MFSNILFRTNDLVVDVVVKRLPFGTPRPRGKFLATGLEYTVLGPRDARPFIRTLS